MPYALFCNDAKLSKAYPTEADVWKHARKSGLVVDVVSEDDKPAPRPVLDNDYEIRPCQPDPQEDPAKNKAEAEREEQHGIAVRFVRAMASLVESGNAWSPLGPGLRRRRPIRGRSVLPTVSPSSSDACSEASVTQALRRCSPLIAPVTLSTLPARTGGILHEGDLIGRQHKRLGFQDGLGKARQGKRGKDQP